MFDQLAGNERVKNLIRRMLETGRLPGALLFTGEEGVGKKLFAFELARALNCSSLQGVEACGACSSCKRISGVNYPTTNEVDDWKRVFWTDHPDVGMVEAPRRVLLVDQMRDIELQANYRPFEGRARVFVIEDADKLNDSSANALLKILEEPPPTAFLILVTSRPAMLIPTVRSRCQMIRFSPLTSDEIERHLTENNLAAPAEARLRARVARGSLGRALSGGFDRFVEQREAMMKVLAALVHGDDRIQLLRSAEDLNSAQYKDEYETRLDVLETLIRDAWILSLHGLHGSLVNYDILAQLEKLSKNLDTYRPARWISQIEEMREQLAVNINRKAATDALFLTMAAATASELPPKRRFLIR